MTRALRSSSHPAVLGAACGTPLRRRNRDQTDLVAATETADLGSWSFRVRPSHRREPSTVHGSGPGRTTTKVVKGAELALGSRGRRRDDAGRRSDFVCLVDPRAVLCRGDR